MAAFPWLGFVDNTEVAIEIIKVGFHKCSLPFFILSRRQNRRGLSSLS
jgi:hypothetical protein